MFITYEDIPYFERQVLRVALTGIINDERTYDACDRDVRILIDNHRFLRDQSHGLRGPRGIIRT